MNDREVEIKFKMFERLSQKGFLQSMQHQMRRAIAEELNDSKVDKQAVKRRDETNDGEEKETIVSGGHESVAEESWDPLAKVSSIANWEKQIRYELEIDKEIQTRELCRQRERLKSESRQLQERDKSVRIELDARERRLRLREEELKTGLEEMNEKMVEMAAKEQTIDSIVNERIRFEIKDEMQRLRQKFNDLEEKELNLEKREEKVKEVEQRLHSQVKIVKEKIDNKKLSEIELAKSRKDLEIIRKENEVLKERVESMEDYQSIKFENRSLKNEINAIKESLKSKLTELEIEREKFDKISKESDEKVLKLRIDLRKCEQQVLLLKQKHQGDVDEYDNRLDLLNSQLRQSTLAAKQLQQKNHLLYKEILNMKNGTQNTMKLNENSNNNNHKESDGQKFGCYICDDNIQTLQESSLDFLLTQKLSFDANNEHKPHSKNPSIPLMRTQENGSNGEHKQQTEVPFSDTSHAIRITPNTCAKHNNNDKQNAIQLMHANHSKQIADTKAEDMKINKNTLNYINKQKEEHISHEDYNKDISNTFDDW